MKKQPQWKTTRGVIGYREDGTRVKVRKGTVVSLIYLGGIVEVRIAGGKKPVGFSRRDWNKSFDVTGGVA